MSTIYLDYNATTPIDPAVVDAMLPYLQAHFGNPSSTHAFGKTAHDAVEHARGQVAALLGAQPDEIVFTGGATEASNHALQGAVFAKLPKKNVLSEALTKAISALEIPQATQDRWDSLTAKAQAGTLGSSEQPELEQYNRLSSVLVALKAKGQRAATCIPENHIITSVVEHPATLKTIEFLERLGCRLTILPVDRHGLVDPDRVRKDLMPATTIVSIMHANNEVGSIQPIRDIAALVKAHGALMHTDAAQSLGKVPVDVGALGVDLLSVAGHKLYAPKGVGALYVRRGVKLEPLIHGAGHEGGRRAGTENVPYIVGLGRACEIARSSLPAATAKLKALRDRLWRLLHSALGEKIALNGHPELRLPNTLNVNFVGHVGADLLTKTPELAASTGSACHEGRISLSPVLAAMGVMPAIGQGAVRLSVGRLTTEEEIDSAGGLLIRAAQGHRR